MMCLEVNIKPLTIHLPDFTDCCRPSVVTEPTPFITRTHHSSDHIINPISSNIKLSHVVYHLLIDQILLAGPKLFLSGKTMSTLLPTFGLLF